MPCQQIWKAVAGDTFNLMLIPVNSAVPILRFSIFHITQNLKIPVVQAKSPPLQNQHLKFPICPFLYPKLLLNYSKNLCIKLLPVFFK